MLHGVVDVQYSSPGKAGVPAATAALITYSDPACSRIVDTYVAGIDEVEPYVPGAFYRRELPCIERVLQACPPLSLLIVDGYATLDPTGAPGLGAHLVGEGIDGVVGVAKTRYRTATHAIPVVRGAARSPLWVTTAGNISAESGADFVRAMAGDSRLPDAVKDVDRLARLGLLVPPGS